MARLSVALTAGLLLVVLAACPRADEKTGEKTPDKPADKAGEKPADKSALPTGTWKVMLPWLRSAGTRPLWLVKLEKGDAGWSGEIVATATGWPKAKLKKVSVTADQLRFDLETPDVSLPCVVKLPKDGKQTRLYGTATLRKSVTPVELEKTTLTSLDPFDQARDALAKQPLGQEAVQLALELISNSGAKKAKPAEVRKWAAKAIKSAALYGVGWQRDIILNVAEILSEQMGQQVVALEYARYAERLLDATKDSPALQKRVLTVLAAALEKADKEEEAKAVNARIKKLDFSIKPKTFAGRKGKSDRVVLVELFTGAQCPPCVAADLAFDALDKTFKPTEVVLLQYHLHIPLPDPLTSPASESRQGFYDEAIRGTPTIFFNGKEAAKGGGGNADAAEKYEAYVDVIEPLLEKPSQAELKLSATQKGNKVSITAEVAKLAETGDDVRLRVVLVEQEVAYKGTNGLPVHHHVVRSMPSGEAGEVLKDKTFKKTFTVDLDDLRKKLKTYLDKYAEKRPFQNKERPLDLKKLRIVAFVQNDKSAAVLQAAQAEIKAEIKAAE